MGKVWNTLEASFSPRDGGLEKIKPTGIGRHRKVTLDLEGQVFTDDLADELV